MSVQDGRVSKDVVWNFFNTKGHLNICNIFHGSYTLSPIVTEFLVPPALSFQAQTKWFRGPYVSLNWSKVAVWTFPECFRYYSSKCENQQYSSREPRLDWTFGLNMSASLTETEGFFDWCSCCFLQVNVSWQLGVIILDDMNISGRSGPPKMPTCTLTTRQGNSTKAVQHVTSSSTGISNWFFHWRLDQTTAVPGDRLPHQASTILRLTWLQFAYEDYFLCCQTSKVPFPVSLIFRLMYVWCLQHVLWETGPTTNFCFTDSSFNSMNVEFVLVSSPYIIWKKK